MITQVSGFNSSGVFKDPRRKAQSFQFKHHANIPYQGSYNDPYVRPKSNAVLTSISIIAGSILFTVGYFMISALSARNLKKAL